MAIQWLRLWHDMPNDPKWRTIARASKQSIPAVLSVYLHLLVAASNASERGRTQNVCVEDVASALDLDAEQVEAILTAMQGRVLDGDQVSGWERRQVGREDDSAARAKKWREDKKERERTESERNRTHTERKQTPDKDKDKEEINNIAPGDAEDLRKCPTGSIINLYHELMPNNPQVKVINDGRKAAIRQRWRDASELVGVGPFGYSTKSDGLRAWRTFFEVCSESGFLTGRSPAAPGKVPFIADIDFIFSPSGFAKILENKYHREAA